MVTASPCGHGSGRRATSECGSVRPAPDFLPCQLVRSMGQDWPSPPTLVGCSPAVGIRAPLGWASVTSL